MKNTTNITISLPITVFDALTQEAELEGVDMRTLTKDILTVRATLNGHMSLDDLDELKLYRSLSQRVADAAVQICEIEGFQKDITARAVQECQLDDNWTRDYARYIESDDIFQKGNPKKRNINPDFGYRVKTRLNARILTENGKRKTAKAKGLVITDYSLLTQ